MSGCTSYCFEMCSGACLEDDEVKAPFIWFGGKRRIADLVWQALGDVDNYIEPFAGSLAVLLERPTWHKARCETVNDADKFLANFWRALSADPEAVASWCDWPVNEADLFARHLWLVNEGRERIASALEADPTWFDAQVAGWWVWGLNSWIGSGWCSGDGPWQLPHLGDAGQGVNRQLPHLRNAGRGDGLLPRNESLFDYFRQLADRLRNVRVCCGDWTRVVTDGAMSYGETIGVFLDPPYSDDVRTSDLYATDNGTVAVDVRRWAIERGTNRNLRIVLAGYETEHAAEMPEGWTMHAYSASAAYMTKAQAGTMNGNQANRRLERLWFSPGCVVAKQDTLL